MAFLFALAVHAAQNASGADRHERPSVDLSGEWEFKLDPRDVGRPEKWFEAGAQYNRKIRVPGAWNAQGVAFESADQLRDYEEERLREQKSLHELGILGVQRESDRLFHVYPGPGWYRTRVMIPADWIGKTPWLVFSGVHREADVWVNDRPAGTHHSYLVPLRIDLSPHAKAGEMITVVVRVDARRRREVDPLMGCLDTLDFLYVTWGGIHQSVKLEAVATTRIEDVFIVPRLAEDTAEIHLRIEGAKAGQRRIIVEIIDAQGAVAASVGRALEDDAAEITLAARLDTPKLWSPKSPYLYTARVQLLEDGKVSDRRSVRFGMREFKVAGGKFLLNGQPIFLRGYGDDCVFPNTISPPADKEALRSRLARAREYGFNYVRHHSWTPPEEYLEAADELGMMLQPEFPFAYRWDLPTTPEAKNSALKQWEAMIRRNRNHPSIVTWCMGNELYDSFDLAPEMYRMAKRLDPTRPVIDSDGCHFKQQARETLDFLVVPFAEGTSIGFQDGKYHLPDGITKPVIAHEMGYFVTLHDLNQLDLFKDGLRPYWLFQTLDLAKKNRVLEVYPEWLASSYRLQAASLKCNMEAARRSRLSGTSVWLFQDYPNCAEGVVDMFGRRKGISPEEFRKFNSPTVLLLDAPRRNWWGGESAEIEFAVSRFEDQPSDDAKLRWELKDGDKIIRKGELAPLKILSGEMQELPTVQLELPNRDRAAKLTLHAELIDANGKADNSWSLWVFPRDRVKTVRPEMLVAGFPPLRSVYPDATEHKDGPVPTGTRLLVTTRIDDDVTSYLTNGGCVLLLDPQPAFAVEKTNFRLSSWDGGGPSGTIFDPRHPALREMPSEGWCDLQFYWLIQKSKTVLLDSLPTSIDPLVRCIDRPTRLTDRAYLFEASVERGKLLVSGFNFAQALNAKDPAGFTLLDQLIRYGLGPDFNPMTSLPASSLRAKAAK